MKIDALLQSYSRSAIIARHNQGSRYLLCCFWNTHDGTLDTGAYSQWYHTGFALGQLTFTSAEQFMMYCKAMLFKDYKIARKIYMSYDPAIIKKLGRKVQNFDGSIWEKYREYIVFYGSYLKFTQNIDLTQMMSNGARYLLIEASPYDKVWGVGMNSRDPNIADPNKWNGENLLGECLMAARECIMAQTAQHRDMVAEVDALIRKLLFDDSGNNAVVTAK